MGDNPKPCRLGGTSAQARRNTNAALVPPNAKELLTAASSDGAIGSAVGDFHAMPERCDKRRNTCGAVCFTCFRFVFLAGEMHDLERQFLQRSQGPGP